MKKLILGMMALMLLTLLGNAAMAQKPKPRDLFIEKEQNEEKGKSGAKVRILLKRGAEKERFVAPTETFYSGDKIKLAFDINFAGHIALLNVGSSGRITMLYPYVGADSAIEPSDKEQLIPANPKDWITFDKTAGTEQITVVFSSNPLNSVAQIVEMSGQGGAETTTTTTTVSGSANANVTINSIGSGSTIYVASSAEAQAILQELNSRSLKRSKTRDLYIETVNNDATYVVAESNLISEPTAFVIALKHKSR